MKQAKSCHGPHGSTNMPSLTFMTSKPCYAWVSIFDNPWLRERPKANGLFLINLLIGGDAEKNFPFRAQGSKVKFRNLKIKDVGKTADLEDCGECQYLDY